MTSPSSRQILSSQAPRQQEDRPKVSLPPESPAARQFRANVDAAVKRVKAEQMVRKGLFGDRPIKPLPFKRHPNCPIKHTEKMCMYCENLIAGANHSPLKKTVTPPVVGPIQPMNSGAGGAVFSSWNGRSPR